MSNIEFSQDNIQKIKSIFEKPHINSLFLNYGFTQLKRPLSFDIYKTWLSQNNHADMFYLEEHSKLKENHKLINQNLISALTFSFRYFPLSHQHNVDIKPRTAIYAQNYDYHYWVKESLKKIIEEIKIIYPNDVYIPFVDSGPVLERDLAYQSGHGWFGKNSCLIHKDHGSLFFIAEILTSIDLTTTENNIQTHPDLCGKCTKCLDICPTQAIKENKTLDANKCISYLTIESKKTPPLELRQKMGDWFFGCDLCQTVCPWNQKQFKLLNIQTSNLTSTDLKLNLTAEQRQNLILFIKDLFTLSNKKIQKKFLNTPLLRARPQNLKRNALVVIANHKLFELLEEVKSIAQSNEELKELAEWCLYEISS